MVDDGTIGEGCRVGPFAYLRPGCTLAEGAQVGRFVELKNTALGERAKVPHLSYVGDADVGAGSNLGASTITANYDGRNKHRTTIGEGVSTMVHSTLVAPVTIGDGAYVAAGSVITEDVEAGALAIARPRQTNQAWICRAGRRAPEGRAAMTPDPLFGASEFLPARGDNGGEGRPAQQLARRHLGAAHDALRGPLEHRPGRAHRRRARRVARRLDAQDVPEHRDLRAPQRVGARLGRLPHPVLLAARATTT